MTTTRVRSRTGRGVPGVIGPSDVAAPVPVAPAVDEDPA